MTTIGDLADLLKMALTHTGNPALRRLPEGERTVEGVARAYLPFDVRTYRTRSEAWSTAWAVSNRTTFDHGYHLHLSDPGTANALLVAFTLSLGRDPGEGGLGVSWYRTRAGAWRLDPGSDLEDAPDEVEAPAVATETSPVRALEQAVAHVLAKTGKPC